MRVTITTDGGFTGRGTGSASADFDESALAALQPERWRESYEAHGADLVRYTLTLGEKRVSWVEGARIPADLRALFEDVWARRR